MRFETSQTTPSLLNRRFQLRMLSFVGLISIVMVTLSVIDTKVPTADDGQRKTAVPLDSLTFEVLREDRTLKPDEVLILPQGVAPRPQYEDHEPRGQFPDVTDGNRSREDVAIQDGGLFKPRSKERSGNDGFFPRRTSRPQSDQRPQASEELRDREESQFDEQPPANSPPTPRHQPLSQPRRDLPPTTTLQDDWEPRTDPIARPRNQNEPPVPTRGQPSSFGDDSDFPDPQFDQPIRTRPTSTNIDENPLEDPREPFRENHPEPIPDYSSPAEFQTNGDGLSSRRRSGKMSPVNDLGREDGTEVGNYDDPPATQPISSRKGKDLWISQPTDPESEPFREDIASVRIDKRYLDLVKDNTVGIRRDEAESFYWLLDHARRVSQTAFERSGLREVQYINLMTEPDRFRGEPITIEGDLWRLDEYEAGPNEYGVRRIYEGWVFTGDSGNHPYRIVCTSLPKGIEPGNNLRKPVRITGYFFKREGYRSNGGIHVAPTLLARRIAINPMPNGIPLPAGIVPYMVAAIMAIGLALLVTVVGVAISDERSSRSGLEKLRHQPHFSFATMSVPSVIPVEESLRQYAELQREAAVSGAYGPLLSRQTAREHAVNDNPSSLQSTIEQDLKQHQRQMNVVQNWAARQKAAQEEIAALRVSTTRRQNNAPIDNDELNSDKLEPARNVLARQTAVPVARTHSFERENQIAIAPYVSPLPENVNTSGKPETYATIKPCLPVIQSANSFTLQNPLSDEREPVPTASEQIERDRHVREQAIRDRVHRQHVESERLQLEQLERQRIEHERLERERQQREAIIQDRVAHEHSFERADRDEATFTLSPSHSGASNSDRLNHERLERERNEREQLEHEQSKAHREYDRHSHAETADDQYRPSGPADVIVPAEPGDHDPATGKRRRGWGWQGRDQKTDAVESISPESADSSVEDSGSESADVDNTSSEKSPSAWGRNRKRRRNWRDGSSN